MKLFVTLLSVLLCPTLVLGQAQPAPVTPDTLDWKRYYPLDVGNVWEYRVAEGEPLLRREIVADTVVAELRYFLMEETSYDYDYVGGGTELEVWRRDTLYVRYDSLGTVVILPEIEADTLIIPRNVPFDGEASGYFDLRSAFGDSVYYGEGADDFYWVQGGYRAVLEIGDDTVEVPALKLFQSPLWHESYAADIGFVGGGNLWGPSLTYAEVGGIMYGVSRTPTTVEEAPQFDGFGIEAVYPNPVRDKAAVVYRSSRPGRVVVEVFNVLGQRIWVEEASAISVGVHVQALDTAGWSIGTYYVRITTEYGDQSVRSVVVTR